MKRFLTFLSIVVAISAAAQQNFDTVKIKPVKVTDHIYMLLGSGGNIGALIGDDGVMIIDDQFAPLSAKINEAIKGLSQSPIRFLINTHVHGDHVGGNINFGKQGVTIVAHDQVRERMTREQVNKRFNRTTPPYDKEALPIITFPDRMNFHFNDEDIELIHLDNGHTDGDVAVFFKKANVIHTGDAFVRYGYPYVDIDSGGGINGFVSSLDKLLSIINDQTKVIPGHGEVATKNDVKILREQVADIRDQVAKALKRGKKPNEMAALGITDKYDEKLGKGFVKGKDYVVLLAESLSKGK